MEIVVRLYSTDCRGWLGTAAYTTDTLREEIQALYEGGFRGVELCMQNASNGAPNTTYAYGSPHWAYMWRLMMNELLDLGMGLYLTSGANWATSNVPGLDPDSQQAMEILAMSKQIVNPGQTITALQKLGTTRATDKGRFIGAYEYKFDSQEPRNVAGRYNHTRTAVVDDTMIPLPAPTQGATVYDQNVTWTATTDGQYVVFSYWAHGAYQTSSPGAETCYATNYFDVRGVATLREFWGANYLSNPVLNQKIMEGDVQLFMDSLEINPNGGITWWAEDIFEEFKARKG
ncbi:MAG: hypothetical protein FWH55_09185 [Oscillospiraceae bacterium]|nr:hypothetical protein [Oscillospiraceae bacterium]